MSHQTKKALAVIDIQPCYMNHYKDKSNFDIFFVRVNHHISSAEQQKIPILLIEHKFDNWMLKLLSKMFYKSSGIPGTEDFPTDARILINPTARFTKTKPDSFKCEDFSKWIEEQGIEHLYIQGQDGIYCIKQTALGAKARGIKVSILQDAVASSKMNKWSQEKEKLANMGIDFSNELYPN